jgi:carbon monoxide dehydrogenase subunit G
MWTAEHTAETDLRPAAIWTALRDLHTGASVSPSGDRFEIHGPFAVGTELDVTPQGQETFRSRITELVENERYADVTEFGDVTLTFRHTLEPTGTGTRITHQLVIDGPGAANVGPELGPQITADFPEALQDLIGSAGGSGDAAAR